MSDDRRFADKSHPHHLLGSAIKITTVLSVDTVTRATITIKDPAGKTVIDAVTMSKEMNKIYSYTYQSVSTGVEGDYLVTITAIYNSYTSVRQSTMSLDLQAV